MPIVNGRRVSLDEWRAAQIEAAAPVVETPTEDAPEAPAPRRRRSPRASAAQVMAELGIVPVFGPSAAEADEPEDQPEAETQEDGEGEAAADEAVTEPETQEPTGEETDEVADAQADESSDEPGEAAESDVQA